MSERRILLTGSSGFLGGHVAAQFKRCGKRLRLLCPPRAHCDLLSFSSCVTTLAQERPDTIVHLAATVGGIGANQREPGRFFYENALMGMNLIEAARLLRVKKFVQVGTVCSYPSRASIPFCETELWDGYPEPTNAPYGIAKKALLTMLQAYRSQYGLGMVYLIPANLYGPGDNYDPDSSHVIPALIRKFYEALLARGPRVTVWGTGRPTREFLYVADAARAIVRAALGRYEGRDPVNLGGTEEISIADLAKMVAREVGYDGKIAFDRTKPDGQMRRKIGHARGQKLLGWRATTLLREGLRETVQRFKETYL